MGEIIFGVIGIGIISAAILNIVSTQRMWTKKIAFLLGLYSYFAYSVLCVSIFPDMKQTAHSPPEIIMAMIIITKSLIIKI